MSNASDMQVGGRHYIHWKIQPWDFIAANELDFFQGNIISYLVRYREKGGVQDLIKARHYLDKYIEEQQAKENPMPEEEKTQPEGEDEYSSGPKLRLFPDIYYVSEHK